MAAGLALQWYRGCRTDALITFLGHWNQAPCAIMLRNEIGCDFQHEPEFSELRECPNAYGAIASGRVFVILREISMTKKLQSKFDKQMRLIAKELMSVTEKSLLMQSLQIKTPPATRLSASVSLDARWYPDTNNYKAKCRAVLSDGSPFNQIQIPDSVADILDTLWIDRCDSRASWFGLFVTVTFDGSHTVELNSDPNCWDVPDWFKT